ncbi:MAG: hypothetical protein IKW60_00780 [Clostridia bacterium]|nr:hypothetical protein [Clostridia bacterium]
MRIKKQGRKKSRGRGILMTLGILFIIAGVFTASFATSFQVMIQAAQSKPDEGSLESENQKLKEENQLLQDRITILETEIKAEKPKEPETTAAQSGEEPSATKKPTSTSKPSSTQKPKATTKPVATQKPTTTQNTGSVPGNALVE